MSIFQRIKAPFTEADDTPAAAMPQPRPVGEILRERREELRLDINDAGEVLRIKPTFLAALEENRPQDLPGPTYVIGFVRAYARHLGLDHEWVLERYKAESAGVQARPDLAFPMPLGERSLPGGPILLVALILAICGYGTWYYLSTGDRARPERVAAVPPALQVPLPDPSAAGSGGDAKAAAPVPAAASPATTANAAPGPAAAGAPGVTANLPASPAGSPQLNSGLFPGSTAAATPASPAAPVADAAAPAGAAKKPAAEPVASSTPAGPQTTVASAQPAPAPVAPAAEGAAAAARIEIKATADCWVQIRAADQSIVFSRVLKSGETYRVPARAGLVLRTGNAGALVIAVDGKQVPSIGPLGTLRRNVVLDPAALIGGTAVQG